MKQKRYFNRILLNLFCVSLVFSLIASVAYYITSVNKLDSDFFNEKRSESIRVAARMEHDLELCGKSARVAAKQLDLALSGKSDIASVFSAAEEIYNTGTLYITDENSSIKMYKKEEAPALPENIFDKVRSMNGSERVFSFMKDGTKYIIAANRVKTGGNTVFVMRSFEEKIFFASSGASAIVFLSDSDEVYLGNDGKCADLKAMINEAGKANVAANLAEAGYRGRNHVYIPVSMEYPQDAKLIFAFDDSTLADFKAGTVFVSVATFFIILILLCLLSLIPAKIIYHPVDELVAFAGFYTDDEERGDEVSYISGAVKELNEKNKQLTAEAEERKELLKIQFIKDLLSGVLSETMYSELAEEFKMTEYETPFYVGIFEISDYDSMAEAFDEKNLIQIKKQIGDFITNELMGRSVSRAVEVDKKRFAVITCGCDLARIRQNFSYIISVINSEYDVEMFSAISGECVSLFEAGEGYQMCSKAFEDSFAMGFRSAVVVYDDIDVGAGFYYPVNLERDLISSVLRLKNEESLKIINNILDENLNGKTLTKEKHNAIIFAFTATINRIVEALNKTVEEVYGEENIIFLELKMCGDAPSLRAKIIQSFEKIMNYMSGDEDADLSQRFLDYIHSHYNEDISLTEIGAHFKLSECYISTVFKESTGENFKDYLSRYRIKKAKEILIKNPDIKTKELAAMIGCNTVATLFRLFNKYEGMSPGQFVKENLKNE